MAAQTAYVEYEGHFRAEDGPPRVLGDLWLEDAIYQVAGAEALGILINARNRYFLRREPLGSLLQNIESEAVQIALIVQAHQIDNADQQWSEKSRKKGSGNVVEFPGGGHVNPYLTQRSFTPPATPFETQQFRAAVVQFASENGMINFDFDGFLKSCEASDWKTTRGSRMTCWRQAVRKYNQYKGTGEKTDGEAGAYEESGAEPHADPEREALTEKETSTEEKSISAEHTHTAELASSSERTAVVQNIQERTSEQSELSSVSAVSPFQSASAVTYSKSGKNVIAAASPAIQHGIDVLHEALTARRWQELAPYIESSAMSDDLIRHAIDLALKNAHYNRWGYVAGTLRNWDEADVRTLDAACHQYPRSAAVPYSHGYPERDPVTGQPPVDWRGIEAVKRLQEEFADDLDEDDE